MQNQRQFLSQLNCHYYDDHPFQMFQQHSFDQNDQVLNIFKSYNVPSNHNTRLMQLDHNQLMPILEQFKIGGRVRKIEDMQFKRHEQKEDFYNQFQRQNYMQNYYAKIEQKHIQDSKTQDYGSQLCSIIKLSSYYKNNSKFNNMKISDLKNNKPKEFVVWGLIIENISMLQSENQLTIMTQAMEFIKVEVTRQNRTQNQSSSEQNDQEYNQKWEAVQSIKCGDIVCLIRPEIQLDYEAYIYLRVEFENALLIQSKIKNEDFFKSIQDSQQKKNFISKYNEASKQLWNEKNIKELIKQLTKYKQYKNLKRLCKLQFENLENSQFDPEIYKTLFICYTKEGNYDKAYEFYQKAKDENVQFDSESNEQQVVLLFQKKQFEEVKKIYSSLDQSIQNKLRDLIQQNNSLSDFINEGKNSNKIIEYLKNNPDFEKKITNYYGPIQIKYAQNIQGNIESTDKDINHFTGDIKNEVIKIGRGVFVTEDIQQRQLIWAERDLSYKSSQQPNNTIQMRQTLIEKLNDGILRKRLSYLYRNNEQFIRNIELENQEFLPDIDLYRDKDKYNNSCADASIISESDLLNIISYSSHTIFPKDFRTEQKQDEQGLWPVFSFVNHSVVNRNIEVLPLNGFLFVYSTMFIPKGNQIYYNYFLNLRDEQKANNIMNLHTIQPY